MQTEETGAGGQRSLLSHLPAAVLLAVMALVWTWPLALHMHDRIPGFHGDNYSFLWNLWWMRKVLSAPELEFFRSSYLLNPFGADLVNHPHTALQGYISATALARLSIIEAENLYIIVSVWLNAVCAYALAFEITRCRRVSLLAAVAFGGSPYLAAQLLGHFDLLTAWVIPLFALFLRRALQSGRVAAALGCGLCVVIAAYSAYYYVVYLALFAVAYTIAAWDGVHVAWQRREPTAFFTLRLVIVGLLALDLFFIVFIATGGGTAFTIGGASVSVREIHNPLSLMWLLAFAWALTMWRLAVRIERPRSETLWRGVQALTITVATFTVLCLPLIMEAVRLAFFGRYASQVYFWRSAPRGVDVLAPLLGDPFHPLYGSAASRLYGSLNLDRIEAVGWLGIVPIIVFAMGKGQWADSVEARRWKVVLIVFAIWALGPFLTAAGFDLGLPLPQALVRFLPVFDNARMPGRAMVCVYLALGVLMALRLAAANDLAIRRFRPGLVWTFIALLALDYLHAPIPLTALDRPAVYEHLASIDDGGVVIEAPFGIGDGLSKGRGSQDRRLLYYATIHGHPVMGGYVGRMLPLYVDAYEAMPVVGNLLRLSNGEEAVKEEAPSNLRFRYLVLNTATASQELIEYVRSNIEMDLIASGDGRELYAVHGARRVNFQVRVGGASTRQPDPEGGTRIFR